MKLVIKLCPFLLLIYSCTSKSGYIYKQKRFYHFETSYNINDTLHLSDYILYGLYDQVGLKNFDIVYLNDDSLFNKFIDSFELLELPLNLNNAHNNKITESFLKNRYSRYKKIDKDYIKAIAKKQDEKTFIIPIIFKYFKSIRHGGIAGADTYPTFYCHFSLAVFIIKNNKIIYYKQMRHVESVDSEFHPYKFEDFKIPIPQEHWDGLVKEVMREYIERRK